jgi:hypothetical protein
MKRITHVKITPKGVSIEWLQPTGEAWEEYKVHYIEAPLPEFTNAMERLASFVIQAKSLSIDPENIDFNVVGLSIKYKGEETEKFTVSARYDNQGANSPECYTTALRTLVAKEDTPDMVSESVRGFVNDIKMQAEAYINGARAQQIIELKDESAPPTAKGKRGRPKKSKADDTFSPGDDF